MIEDQPMSSAAPKLGVKMSPADAKAYIDETNEKEGLAPRT